MKLDQIKALIRHVVECAIHGGDPTEAPSIAFSSIRNWTNEERSEREHLLGFADAMIRAYRRDL